MPVSTRLWGSGPEEAERYRYPEPVCPPTRWRAAVSRPPIVRWCDVSNIAILLIAVLGPWAVHLAPPRQRPLALVIIVALLLLMGIYARNPLTTWYLWAGLVAGLLTVAAVGAMGSRAQHGPKAPRSRRGRGTRNPRESIDPSSEQTGEL
jgi:hypothetical protein